SLPIHLHRSLIALHPNQCLREGAVRVRRRRVGYDVPPEDSGGLFHETAVEQRVSQVAQFPDTEADSVWGRFFEGVVKLADGNEVPLFESLGKEDREGSARTLGCRSLQKRIQVVPAIESAVGDYGADALRV